MNKERVNLIIRNLELLLDSLKKELNSESISDYGTTDKQFEERISDYDEVFEDE